MDGRAFAEARAELRSLSSSKKHTPVGKQTRMLWHAPVDSDVESLSSSVDRSFPLDGFKGSSAALRSAHRPASKEDQPSAAEPGFFGALLDAQHGVVTGGSFTSASSWTSCSFAKERVFSAVPPWLFEALRAASVSAHVRPSSKETSKANSAHLRVVHRGPDLCAPKDPQLLHEQTRKKNR